MKILTGRQIREADRATIEREPISSLDLMERAARGISRWIADNIPAGCRLVFCCGIGGNGGDGLAAARILANEGRECTVFLGADPNELHADAKANLARLPEGVKVHDITAERLDIEPDTVIVDALLGVGVTGGVREPARDIVEWINSLPNRVISIDIPSGMSTEPGICGISSDVLCAAKSAVVVADVDATTVVNAETTLTIGFPKLAMLLPQSGECAGNVTIIPISLDEKFIAATDTPYYYITEEWIEKLRLPRAKFSYKGNYGHALLVCGSAAMPGAAILATGGALRSGCGLVTTHVPEHMRFALITNHPSAMLSLDKAECFSTVPILRGKNPPAAFQSALSDASERFSAIGVGSGIGRDPRTVDALGQLLAEVFGRRNSDSPQPRQTMVLDADALNIVAENPHFKQLIPAGSILTPHPGELRRLVGEWQTDEEKLAKASKLAVETTSIIIVKGAHSVICTPDGRFIFNSTGTPGMAKGGSGDVLTGLITGLAACGYDAETASIIGVYTHGMAGERAAQRYGEEAMNASDLIEFLLKPKGDNA